MLLDDLLNDGRVMQRLAGLLRRRSRPTYETQLHESFLDQAALQEELISRLKTQGRAYGRPHAIGAEEKEAPHELADKNLAR